jgi:hypothetical protein
MLQHYHNYQIKINKDRVILIIHSTMIFRLLGKLLTRTIHLTPVAILWLLLIIMTEINSLIVSLLSAVVIGIHMPRLF